MTEREALLRAVCEFPDDDTPRLVFADWLQKHGEEERAEFIRVQVEGDRGTKVGRFRGPYDPHAQALLERHESEWRSGLTDSPGFGWGAFRRGFVDTLFIHRRPGTLPFEYWPLAIEVAPVQDLLLSGGVPCQELLAWRCLKHLRMLEFYAPGWSDDDWLRFADGPCVDGMGLWVSVDYPSDVVLKRLESRFSVEWFAS